MELKRYILTDSYGENEIIDIEARWNALPIITQNAFQDKERELLFSYKEENILKTSDYILDLVEEGDLVEGIDGVPITYVSWIDKHNHLSSDGYYFSYNIGGKFGDEVIAIYKKIPSGYTKYEVNR